MTFENKEALIKYRIEKAKKTLESAELLIKGEGQGFSMANRLYYASFYAVLALLAKMNIEYKSHKSVKNALSQYFILTKKMDVKWGEMYIDLFEMRQDGDYVDMLDVENEFVAPYIEQYFGIFFIA
jgi:uncharacterized protein (UPF0332 family)